MDQSMLSDAKPRTTAASMRSPDQTRAEDIVVRRPTKSDIPGLAAHFSEMQIHYKCPVSDAAAAEAAALACQPPTGTFDPRVLIAVVGNTVVGSLVMNVTFPAHALTKSLYIRDLYVAKSMRRSRVGRMLVTAATHLSVSEGFYAVEWTTDSANKAARKLYESCGARQIDRTYFSERRAIASERRGNARPVIADRRQSRASTV
jgi:ribosomal protein S18 acetylase RimI-like enzyme